MAVWEKLDDVSTNINNEPWSLYWSEIKTGTQEFEDFIHNPLGELTTVIGGINADWKVQTQMLGHEIGLLVDAVCRLVLVDPRSKTLYLTLYKH